MKKFHLFVFILILFILQYSVLGVFFQSGRIPNLFVALVASLAIIFGFERSVGWVIFAGLLLDVGSFWFVGSGALALVVILWLIDRMKVITEFRSKRYLFVLLLFLTAWVSSAAFDILVKFILGVEDFFYSGFFVPSYFLIFGKDYFLKTTYTALSVIAVYFFARKMSREAETLSAAKERKMLL